MRRALIILLAILIMMSVFGYLLTRSVPMVPAQGEADLRWGAYTYTPVIDPGHGGPDPGTESPSGAKESRLNLEIALKTDLLMRLMGLKTVMTRDADVSLHDADAVSIREQKNADIRKRVSLVNETENGVLLSIHQNYFDQRQYHGAQVFYHGAANKDFADMMQNILRRALDPLNTRECKPINNIYLLNNVSKPAILIECGFLSNPEEEALLRSDAYQRKVAMAICQGFLAYAKGMQMR